MKLLTTVFFLLFSLTVFGQTSDKGPIPTTEEEYNYLTKGYKVQIESGLDMKKGYSFENMGEVDQKSYKFTIKGLMRTSQKELAALLVITKSNVSGSTYYTCIPINNQELSVRYFNSINGWDDALITSYCFVVSSYLSTITAYTYQLEKKNKK